MHYEKQKTRARATIDSRRKKYSADVNQNLMLNGNCNKNEEERKKKDQEQAKKRNNECNDERNIS